MIHHYGERWLGPTITFGRYRGRPIREVPEDYLRWSLTTRHLSSSLRRAIEDHLDADRPEDDIDPDPASAAVALPLIAWQWMASMQSRYAGDPAALVVVGVGLTLLKSLCTRYTRRPWPEGGAG